MSRSLGFICTFLRVVCNDPVYLAQFGFYMESHPDRVVDLSPQDLLASADLLDNRGELSFSSPFANSHSLRACCCHQDSSRSQMSLFRFFPLPEDPIQSLGIPTSLFPQNVSLPVSSSPRQGICPLWRCAEASSIVCCMPTSSLGKRFAPALLPDCLPWHPPCSS